MISEVINRMRGGWWVAKRRKPKRSDITEISEIFVLIEEFRGSNLPIEYRSVWGEGKPVDETIENAESPAHMRLLDFSRLRHSASFARILHNKNTGERCLVVYGNHIPENWGLGRSGRGAD